ncbi:MAG: hypothetical protein ABSC23_08970 [Bryobacteraceae bacterium]|jgi:septal ring factor EnvC (AmiA/AmiB activator)
MSDGYDYDRGRVNKGYHYIRYALFGFFLIFFAKMVEWSGTGILPPRGIAALATAVTSLIIAMDFRNYKLWRDNEQVETGPGPGPRVITYPLYIFYLACLVALVFFYQPAQRIAQHAPPVPAQQKDFKGAGEEQARVQQETTGLTTTRQTLAVKIQQDQMELQTLAARLQQTTEQVHQAEQKLKDLAKRGEEAEQAAAALTTTLEAEQQHLSERRSRMQAQQQEISGLEQSLARQRAAADVEVAQLAGRTQALAWQGWIITQNISLAILLVIVFVVVVAAVSIKVFSYYYR